jgi:hypothetical protein
LQFKQTLQLYTLVADTSTQKTNNNKADLIRLLGDHSQGIVKDKPETKTKKLKVADDDEDDEVESACDEEDVDEVQAAIDDERDDAGASFK